MPSVLQLTLKRGSATYTLQVAYDVRGRAVWSIRWGSAGRRGWSGWTVGWVSAFRGVGLHMAHASGSAAVVANVGGALVGFACFGSEMVWWLKGVEVVRADIITILGTRRMLCDEDYIFL